MKAASAIKLLERTIHKLQRVDQTLDIKLVLSVPELPNVCPQCGTLTFFIVNSLHTEEHCPSCSYHNITSH